MSDNTPTPWDKDAAEAVRLAQQFREYHHKALWEEEKHFTWLLSIILAAQAAILTKNADDLEARGLLLAVLAIAGLALVIVSLRVVRREGAFFVTAHRLFVKRFNILFPDQKLEEPVTRPEPFLLTLPLRVLLGCKTSIRDNFQFVFLVFGAIDVALLIGLLCSAI
ncbi:MAG: hypothetical protein EPO31_07190 [Gammaproteobacteria bacterium]|nr:MAG: hypothetical protein EPO31_07190 [Gammaproteobacteria bacterium]